MHEDKIIERQREHFEFISEKYYTSRQNKNHLLLKDLLWGFFLKNKNFLKKNGMNVLEPMCGYGEGKNILEKHLGVNFIYNGFDYSSNLINKIKRNNPKLNVFVMDINKFSSANKYDLIIIIGGIHHVPFHADDVIKKMADALVVGGYFICFEPTHNNFLFKKIREVIYKNNNLFDNGTEKAFELEKINLLFKKNGFKIVDQIYPGLLSYILFYNPDAFPFLNIGGKFMVKLLFSFDKLFFRNFIGRKLSFATMSLLQKK